MSELPFQVRTAFLLLSMLGLLQALGSWIALRASRRSDLLPSQRLWLGGSWAAAGLTLMIGLRGEPASTLNLLASNACLLLWIVLTWSALRLERGLRPAWRPAMVLSLASLLLYVTLLSALGEARSTTYPALLALAGCLILGWQARALARAEPLGGAHLMTLAFGLTALVLLVRGVAVLTSAQPLTSISAGPTQVLMALGSISIFVLSNLGYLGLQIERQTSERLQVEREQARVEARSVHAQERVRALQLLVDERDLLIDRLQRIDAVQQQALLAAALPHELRQPLGALRLNLDLLAHSLAAQGGVSEDLLDALDRDTQRLSSMIEEFMALISETDLAEPDDEFDTVEVVGVARAALQALEPRARLADVQLQLQRQPQADGPVSAHTSAAMLHQVLLILLANALDAVSEQPAPRRVVVEVVDDAHEVQVRVTDNGPGIPEHVQPHLFQPFASTKPAGTGIGLALARRLARRCDVELSTAPARAHSERPGAVFIVHLSKVPDTPAADGG